MKTSTRNILLALSIILILVCSALFFMDGPSIIIDDVEMNGFAGAGIGVLGCLIGLVAAVFAISLTGLILAGVAIFLVLLGVFIFGTVALALSPLLLPFLLVLTLVWLIGKRKTV
jgi:hypothetical protein